MNKLKELRLKKNMTLKQVADAIGVSEATAQRYETGRISTLKYEKAEALAKLFNVSPGYLMGWSVGFEALEKTPVSWTDEDQSLLFSLIAKHGDDALKSYLASSYSYASKDSDSLQPLLDAWMALSDEGQEQLIQYAKFLLSQEEKL